MTVYEAAVARLAMLGYTVTEAGNIPGFWTEPKRTDKERKTLK